MIKNVYSLIITESDTASSVRRHTELRHSATDKIISKNQTKHNGTAAL